MRSSQFITESPAIDLAKKLPSLQKHDYDTIDTLMRKVSQRHRITGKHLHNLFVEKFGKTPDSWIKDNLSENDVEDADINLDSEVSKFVDWASRRLHLKSVPKIELSRDTQEAQDNHHTGSHRTDTGEIWVYVSNRNLVDILRTVFHELVHQRQGELKMIKPGDSYPGSPIEAMADVLAGKYIKIYGEQNHHIFQ